VGVRGGVRGWVWGWAAGGALALTRPSPQPVSNNTREQAGASPGCEHGTRNCELRDIVHCALCSYNVHSMHIVAAQCSERQ
jgi:hypothetical protein